MFHEASGVILKIAIAAFASIASLASSFGVATFAASTSAELVHASSHAVPLGIFLAAIAGSITVTGAAVAAFLSMKTMVAEARKEAAAVGRRVDVLVAELRKLPCMKHSFTGEQCWGKEGDQ